MSFDLSSAEAPSTSSVDLGPQSLLPHLLLVNEFVKCLQQTTFQVIFVDALWVKNKCEGTANSRQLYANRDTMPCVEYF